MPSISFTEQRAVSVGHVIEAEIQPGLSTDFKPEEKTAVRFIPEHVQTAVADVQVAYYTKKEYWTISLALKFKSPGR